MGHSGSGRQGEPGIREAGISEQLRVGLGIALSNHVGSGGQVASVAEVTSVGGDRGDGGGDSNMGDGGGVVDEGGGSGENTAGSGDNSGLRISRPLSVPVVANCDGDGVGGDLLGDLGGAVNHRLDDWDGSHSTDRGTNQSGGGKASVGESTVSEKLGVGLGGGQGQGRGNEKSCCGAHDAVAACT